MATDWKYRLYLFVRAVDATPANKSALAAIYSDNGSGETLADELKMFDGPVRLSLSGEEPAQAYGLNLTGKLAMKDAFVSLISGLTDAEWAVVANSAHDAFADGELIATSFPVTPSGQIVTWDDALAQIQSKYGLVVIVPPETTTEVFSTRAANLLHRFVGSLLNRS